MLDANATTQNGAAPRSTVPSDLERIQAQRKLVDHQLATDFQAQAVWLLERSHELLTNRPFDTEAVQEKLHQYLGHDMVLVGHLEALDYLEHPGSAARPRNLGRGRALGGGIG